MPRTAFREVVSCFTIGLVMLLACGGGDRSSSKTAGARSAARGRGACAPAGTDIVGLAVTRYVRDTRPTAQRFLNAAGSDSALPEAGMRALQDKGPTWFYSSDSAQKAALYARMKDLGSYTTLLVSYQGMRQVSDSEATVKLRGNYVGGEIDGLAAPERDFRFACDSSRWVLRATPVP